MCQPPPSDRSPQRHAGPRWRHALAAALAGVALAAAGALPPAAAAPALSRQQALAALAHAQAMHRAAAVARLADVGTMADVPRLARRLRDEDEDVRELAGSAMWMIWSRSGNRSVDRVFNQGVRQLGLGELRAAEGSFSRVIRLRPGFAEAWNKRATVRYLLGDDAASLKDCEEALRRNPLHFGALVGMAQIHWRRGDADLALRAYERALQVNPNLDGGPELLERLEDAVRRSSGEKA